jgi:hypothetical protein
MTDLPYHHDLTPRFETSFGLRLKWFGRWSETPEWKIEPSRLASDLICFFYVESGSCDLVINGTPLPLQSGELAVLRGGDVLSGSHDPAKPYTYLSACLSLSRDDTANVLLRHAYPRHCRLKDRKSYEKMFAAVLTALESESRWRNFHATGAIFQWLAELQEAVRPAPGAAGGESGNRPSRTHRAGLDPETPRRQGHHRGLGGCLRAQRELFQPPVQGAHRHVAEGMAHRGAAPASHSPAGRPGRHGRENRRTLRLRLPLPFLPHLQAPLRRPPRQLPPRPPGARVCGAMKPARSCFMLKS